MLDDDARRLLDTAFERLKLSAGDISCVLRVARTIADLDASDGIRIAHVAEAVSFTQVSKPRSRTER